MKNLTLLLLAVFMASCVSTATGPRRKDVIHVGDIASMADMCQLPKIDLPVVYAVNTAGMTWMQASYNYGMFGLPNHDVIVEAAVDQCIIPDDFRISRYNLDELEAETEKGKPINYILLILNEEDTENGRLTFQIFFGTEATSPISVRMKKRASLHDRYAHFWWDVRKAFEANFDYHVL